MPDPQTQSPSTDPAKSPLAADPSAAAATSATTTSAPAPTTAASAPARPEGLPDAFFDAGAGVKWKELLAEREELTALKTAQDARKADVPTEPGKYELKLPEEFKLPDGMQLNEKDARLQPLREFAHKQGWTQNDFAAVVAMDAQRVIAEKARFDEAVAGERNKLGQNAGPRVDAVVQFINGTAKSPEQAKQVAAMLITAETVEWFERAIEATTKQGVTTFQRGTTQGQPDPHKVDGYLTMTFEQRMAIARQRNQERSRATA